MTLLSSVKSEYPNVTKVKKSVKFMFSKKATKIDKIFAVDLMVTTYCQIDSENFVNFCGLLRKCERKRGKYLLKTSISKYTIATSEKSSFIP